MRYLEVRDGNQPTVDDELLVMNDVHLGPFGIWVDMEGTVFVDID